MHLDRGESVAVSGNATRFYGLHCSNYENCKTLLFRLRREKCDQAEFTSSTFDVLLNLNQTYTLLADSLPKITRFQPYPRQIYVLTSFHYALALIKSAAFSATAYIVSCKCAPTINGIIDASTTLNPLVP